MPFVPILHSLWVWFVETGLDLTLWILLAFLVPRFGRLAMRLVERSVEKESDENDSKTHLAIAGVAIYIAQLIAYFVIFVFILQELGFSLAGAAIPATAASAAIGLGAQSIIADFLAGFFVLTERHYGVGDWVRFEGGATTVEGTVIQITMRATRIRTLADETVIIPNSKAGVSINNSNYWSSAVLVMPVPLLGSRSIQETMQRATKAAQRAIKKPAVAELVLGELNVHEPLAVTEPTTVGMPWTVNLRFLCQVKPGSQGIVERALRTEIIQEFWDEYGSAPTLTGAVASELTPAHPEHQRDVTQTLQGARPSGKQSDSTEEVASISHAEHTPEVATEIMETPTTVDPERKGLAADDPAVVTKEDEEDNTLQSEPEGWRGFFHKILTVGGRTRTSTALLTSGLILVLLFKIFTYSNEDAGVSGWLAPGARSTETSAEETPTPSHTTEEPAITQNPDTPTATNNNYQGDTPTNTQDSGNTAPTTGNASAEPQPTAENSDQSSDSSNSGVDLRGRAQPTQAGTADPTAAEATQ